MSNNTLCYIQRELENVKQDDNKHSKGFGIKIDGKDTIPIVLGWEVYQDEKLADGIISLIDMNMTNEISNGFVLEQKIYKNYRLFY